jgi:hypothetical protein
MTKAVTPRRATTCDRGPPAGPDIHTTEQLGPNMSRTPNGNLICRAVPIARVGWMIYGPNEVPIKAGPDGVARVYRGPDELFKPECVGSFMGSAVVDEHPEDDVTPSNWKQLSQGFSTTHVYRGSGEDADVLMADLVITDEDLIKSILDGKREVSCGYDADYKQTGVGEGLQTNIIGNHIALVERGRCGPRCAIGDQDYQRKEDDMATKVTVKTVDKRAQVRNQLRKAFRDAMMAAGGNPDDAFGVPASGESEDPSEGGDEDTGGTHIHIHTNGSPDAQDPQEGAVSGQDDAEGGNPDGGSTDPTEQRFQALESSLAALTEAVNKLAGGGQSDDTDDEAPDAQSTEGSEGAGGFPAKTPTDDDAEEAEVNKEGSGKTMDSAALETGYRALMADAEVLVPGFRAPTFDSKAKRKSTVDSMCAARRKVLDLAYSTNDGKTVIDSVSGGSALNLAGMTCVQTASLFKAAAGAKKLLNNRQATGDASRVPNQQAPAGRTAVKSISDVNKANADFWAAKKKVA